MSPRAQLVKFTYVVIGVKVKYMAKSVEAHLTRQNFGDARNSVGQPPKTSGR